MNVCFHVGIDPHHFTCRLKKTHSESGIFTAYVVTDKAGGKNADSKEQQYIEVRVMFAYFTFFTCIQHQLFAVYVQYMQVQWGQASCPYLRT